MKRFEEIEQYIARTLEKANIREYDAMSSELLMILDRFPYDRFRSLYWAFKYGRAKGYRAAQAEMKKAARNCNSEAAKT